MKNILKTLVLLATLTGFFFAYQNFAAANSPNIIIIQLDDLGTYDISPYYSQIEQAPQTVRVQTPNIQGIADRGMRFDQYYARSVCCPARVSILSGKYPQEFGIRRQIRAQKSFRGVPASAPSIPKMLKQVGYQTLHIGKWHRGRNKEEFTPAGQGFDEYIKLDSYTNLRPLVLVNDCAKDGSNCHWKDNVMPRIVRWNKGHNSYQIEGLSQNKFTDATIDFINRHSTNPFFIYLNYWSPHVPYFEDKNSCKTCNALGAEVCKDSDVCLNEDGKGNCQKYKARCYFASQNSFNTILADHKKNICEANGFNTTQCHDVLAYGAIINDVDTQIGRILAHLENQGILDNTLIFFSSDNGGINFRKFYRTNGPLLGHKGSLYEGGIRAPLLAMLPSKIPAGSSTKALISINDFYNTIAEIVGADSEVSSTDSISFKDFLLNPDKQEDVYPDRSLFWELRPTKEYFERANSDIRNDLAIRDKNWKLYFGSKGYIDDLEFKLNHNLLVKKLYRVDPSTHLIDESVDYLSKDPQTYSTIANELLADYNTWRWRISRAPLKLEEKSDNVKYSSEGTDINLKENFSFPGPRGYFRLSSEKIDQHDGDLTVTMLVSPLEKKSENQLLVYKGTNLGNKSWAIILTPDNRINLQVESHRTKDPDNPSLPTNISIFSACKIRPGQTARVSFTVLGFNKDNLTLRLFINDKLDKEVKSIDNQAIYDIKAEPNRVRTELHLGSKTSSSNNAFVGGLNDLKIHTASFNKIEINKLAQNDNVSSVLECE